MMLIFAVCALLLAAAGSRGHGYSVTQRTMKSECAWRWSEAFRHAETRRRGAMKMAAIGLSIAWYSHLLLTRALSSVLFGVVQVDM